MRIQPTAKSSGIGPTAPVQPDTTHAAPATVGADHVDLSALSQAAAGLAPQQLKKIQAQVGSGTYQANAAEVSHRIVDFYLIPVK
jgi:hypothetical protein